MANSIDPWFRVLTVMEACFRQASTHPFNTDRDFANLLYSVLSGAAKSAFEACVAGQLGHMFPAVTGPPQTTTIENVANLLTRARRDATRLVYQSVALRVNPAVGQMSGGQFLALQMSVAFPGNGLALLQQELSGSDRFFANEPPAQLALAGSFSGGGAVGNTIELVHQFK